MNTNSNSYTIIYASIMVVIVAFLLAFVSSSLKEKQYQNVEQDTKKQILAALNVYDVKDVNAEYDKYVKEVWKAASFFTKEPSACIKSSSFIKEKLRVWVQKSPLLSSRISSWANM